MASKKRIYVAHTGGTIGMKRTADGYAPEPGFLAGLMERMPELQAPSMPEYTIREYDPLLDSADMSPDDWYRIATDLASVYADYDGFVVLHGTDTMAYTASALPFLLSGLNKPVVLTGSQIPLCEVRTDARDNLITSLMIAAEYRIPEVCVCFGDLLLRGCRTVKVSASGFRAFRSPNFPPLGEIGIDIRVHWQRVLTETPERSATHVDARARDPKVVALRLFPGMSAEVVRNLARPPLDGLVLEGYGIGNAPSRDPEFHAALREATENGVVVVAVSQCFRGSVHLGSYASGAALRRAGVIGGLDMTAEAALAKLYWLFATGLDAETVRRRIVEPLHGELTPRVALATDS